MEKNFLSGRRGGTGKIFKKNNKIFHKGTFKEIKEFLNQFFLSDRTKELYLYIIKSFIKNTKEINEETIRKYLKKRPRSYVKSAVRYYLMYLGLKKYEIEELLPKIKEPTKKLKVEITRNKLREYVNKLEGVERLIYEILYWTGSRISEVLNLRANQIKDRYITFHTKGDKERVCPIIDNKLYEMLKKYIENKWIYEELFYPQKKHKFKKLKYELYKKYPKEIVSVLLKTHNFRRVIASRIIEKKGVAHAQKFLGHSNINTTMRYVTEITDKKLIEESVEVLK